MDCRTFHSFCHDGFVFYAESLCPCGDFSFVLLVIQNSMSIWNFVILMFSWTVRINLLQHESSEQITSHYCNIQFQILSGNLFLPNHTTRWWYHHKDTLTSTTWLLLQLFKLQILLLFLPSMKENMVVNDFNCPSCILTSCHCNLWRAEKSAFKNFRLNWFLIGARKNV